MITLYPRATSSYVHSPSPLLLYWTWSAQYHAADHTALASDQQSARRTLPWCAQSHQQQYSPANFIFLLVLTYTSRGRINRTKG